MQNYTQRGCNKRVCILQSVNEWDVDVIMHNKLAVEQEELCKRSLG